MLIELLLILVVQLLDLIVSIIPELSIDGVFLSGFESVGWLMGTMAYIVPMGTFLSCLSVFFLLHNITFVIACINWVIRKIPGIS